MHWINFRVRVLCLGMFILLGGCHSKDYKARKAIEEWYGKTVTFPDSPEAKILGRDTTVTITELLDKEYCVLAFFDSTGCTECNMKLHDWHLRIKDIAGQQDKVNFIFVVHAKNYEAVSAFAVKNKFNHLIFHDTDNALWKANQNLPDSPELQAFLLDREQKVVLVGNPARNNSLWKLYKQQIEKTTHDEMDQ